MNVIRTSIVWLLIVPAVGALTATWCAAETQGPVLLDDQFVLPDGFHIYRAATRELSGGSYAMAFDGQGRLLVGEGNSIRQLIDSDGDQVYDKFETTLVDADGQLHIAPANKVEEIGFSKTSPMPDGLLNYLDSREIHDLIAYLRSL